MWYVISEQSVVNSLVIFPWFFAWFSTLICDFVMKNKVSANAYLHALWSNVKIEIEKFREINLKIYINRKCWFHGIFVEKSYHRIGVRVAQCGNLAIFLPLRFYVKSILADFSRSIWNFHFNNFGGFEFCILVISHFKIFKIPKSSKSRAAKMVKMAVFDSLKSAKIDFT